MGVLAYRGKVVGNTIVLEEPAELPEGAVVEVRLLPGRAPSAIDAERQEALRRLLSMNLPVADWEQMEDEISGGVE